MGRAFACRLLGDPEGALERESALEGPLLIEFEKQNLRRLTLSAAVAVAA